MIVIGRRSAELSSAKGCAGVGNWRLQSGFRRERLLRAELRYRPEQSSTVADRDAEFLEVAVGQVGENVETDLVVLKFFLVSAETETAEPHADIHDRALAGVE